MSPGYRPSYDIGEAQRVSLPERGTTGVWDSGVTRTSSASPAVLLLHGWNVDAPTNYGFAFPHIARSHRVVMFDQHGHGQGLRNDAPFTLASAAKDAITVLDALDIDSAIIVGYSLGGAVAQTLLHNYPNRCAGIVLSATAGNFAETQKEAIQFKFLARAARLLRGVPDTARDSVFAGILKVFTRRYPDWIADVVRQADAVTLLEAGAALGSLSPDKITAPSPVPSSFVVTATDKIVPQERQVRLATQLGVGSMHNVYAGHEVPIRNDREFNDALVEAVRTVADQAQAGK